MSHNLTFESQTSSILLHRVYFHCMHYCIMPDITFKKWIFLNYLQEIISLFTHVFESFLYLFLSVIYLINFAKRLWDLFIAEGDCAWIIYDYSYVTTKLHPFCHKRKQCILKTLSSWITNCHTSFLASIFSLIRLTFGWWDYDFQVYSTEMCWM